MAVTADGTTLYVAAFGSGKIGVFQTAELEDDSFVPDAASHIELTGGGPTGLVLDEARGRLYVLTRFDNTVSVVDTVSRQEIAGRPLYNPEPAYVVAAGAGVFRPSDNRASDLTDAQLRALARRTEVTYTCVPLGSGVRVALDADLDGCFNTTEARAGYDPRDPASKPSRCR